MGSAFESLYSKLILRDILGRALPGSILFIFFFYFDGENLVFNLDVSGSQLVLITVAGYIFMHLLTYVGARFGLIDLFVWDGNNGEFEQSIQKLVEFLNKTEQLPELSKERERLVTFKTLFGGIFLGQMLAAGYGLFAYSNWMFLIVLLFAFLSRLLHIQYANEQKCLESKVINGPETPCP